MMILLRSRFRVLRATRAASKLMIHSRLHGWIFFRSKLCAVLHSRKIHISIAILQKSLRLKLTTLVWNPTNVSYSCRNSRCPFNPLFYDAFLTAGSTSTLNFSFKLNNPKEKKRRSCKARITKPDRLLRIQINKMFLLQTTQEVFNYLSSASISLKRMYWN